MVCRLACVLVALHLAFCLGCGEPKGGPRVDTFPVKGTVVVDGAPVLGILVACYPQGNAELKHRLTATTNDQGEFTLGTYEFGDGLPEGEYKIAFEWITGSMLGRETDKFKGVYSDPEKSEFSVTVKKGEENDLGEIHLSTKK